MSGNRYLCTNMQDVDADMQTNLISDMNRWSLAVITHSGCTNHMTHDQKLFKELDKTIVSKVKIGNGDFISIKGKGTVAIESLTGLKYISDVLYVPDIDQNLLSVGQLVEKGFKVIFEDNLCLIKDTKGKDIFRVKMRAKSYALNLMEEEQIAFSSMTNNADLWHKRLGHFHLAGLLYMQKHALVKGVSMLEDKLANCVACQYGKLIRKPFPQTAWRATQKLQLVHTDVGGPQRVKRDKLDKKAEPGVFIGYSNTSKAYRIFQPQNGKILVSRDVKFMEDQQWSWEKPIIKQLPEIPQLFDDDVDDIPVRGTRSLSEIYQLSNMAILEPAEFEEAEKDENG
ncbi:hypothetical protein L6164_002617 [Bauhinia variegata]|uniref:Uncharacterized protein n=1 Tax=Bauhinia variegata TaxID=167791 RepID=A0ACB9Q1F9_BAUVA|nr:hypothetical protein L6164_002617 [Bauhinia variegata]